MKPEPTLPPPAVGSVWRYPGGKVVTVTSVQERPRAGWQVEHSGNGVAISQKEWKRLGLKPHVGDQTDGHQVPKT